MREIVEKITNIPVHPRAPYAGDFYFLALSGAHQDAIRKGFAKRDDIENGDEMAARKVDGSASTNGHVNGLMDKIARNASSHMVNGHAEKHSGAWRVPYLPMDPADVGVEQASIIGINSQSGKSGILWILQHTLGLHPPKGLAINFSQIIKAVSLEAKRDLPAEEICDLFLRTYQKTLQDGSDNRIERLLGSVDVYSEVDVGHAIKSVDAQAEVAEVVHKAVKRVSVALDVRLNCCEYASHLVERTGERVAFVKCSVDVDSGGNETWGIGFGSELGTAYMSAILSTVAVSKPI